MNKAFLGAAAVAVLLAGTNVHAQQSANATLPPASGSTPSSVAAADTQAYELEQVSRRPRVVNARFAQAALTKEYPPLLQQAGIDGTTVLRVMVDEHGRVARVFVSETSGRTEFDAAAQRAAPAFRYTPALKDGHPVRVWACMVVHFTTDKGTDTPFPELLPTGQPSPVRR